HWLTRVTPDGRARRPLGRCQGRPPDPSEPIVYPLLLLIDEEVAAQLIHQLSEDVDLTTELDPLASVIPGERERVEPDTRLPEHSARLRPPVPYEQIARSAIG